MSLEVMAEIGFMEKVTHLGMDLARSESLDLVKDKHRDLLRALLATQWSVTMERPYRWVITSPTGDILTFDEKHGALNIDHKRG
ncbi:hypothetical protein HZB58_03320 [Candidatus Gottesmanbacteria bacterium]|nr:hypothetical protein [Candidatus Gottesmanbacteria bacterium]